MSYNSKQTSKNIASLGAKVMSDKSSSKIAKSLGGSTVSQYHTGNQTSSKMETIASKVLKSPKYNQRTKKLAGAVLSQSNKER
ncbi:hypothetical protein [Arcobacter sp. F2176]|uniref:hypothetical protein n=1 Tax=Arcobacter sp. F2176 TaxID=2044511 RepID=UPI00100B92CB|nr:hypothetical protein [Arcobacter sp. F2176]RXJ81528.1 hypothetical protein CRU95_06365 [Arcobacter sp. F2176]